jgi:hypothetical protein
MLLINVIVSHNHPSPTLHPSDPDADSHLSCHYCTCVWNDEQVCCDKLATCAGPRVDQHSLCLSCTARAHPSFGARIMKKCSH